MKIYNSFNEMFNAQSNAIRDTGIFNDTDVWLDSSHGCFVVDVDGSYLCSVNYDNYPPANMPGTDVRAVEFFSEPWARRYNSPHMNFERRNGTDYTYKLIMNLWDYILESDSQCFDSDGYGISRDVPLNKEEAKNLAEKIMTFTDNFTLQYDNK